MDGFPVTIRLIDPPLHEFVPHEHAKQAELAQGTGHFRGNRGAPRGAIARSQPHAGTPRVSPDHHVSGNSEMQVRAIIEAAIECHKAKVKVIPEIMIPLTLDKKELGILVDATRRVADDLIKKAGVKLHYMVGTMIELPRAALLADEIAEVAEFFSFGTNDLTQTTMGLSRDDAGRFLPDYVDEKKAAVFHGDPFRRWISRRGNVDKVGDRKGARDASKAGGGHLRRTRRRCRKREVLPSGWHGLRERFAVPRADSEVGGGASGGRRQAEGQEQEEE